MAEKFWTRGKNKWSPPEANVSVAIPPIEIEYPVEGERIAPGHYAVRIVAPPNAQVRLSINNGSWETCRFSVGHYWYDWHPGRPGTYKMTARSRVGNSAWKTSKERSCSVIGSGKN